MIYVAGPLLVHRNPVRSVSHTLWMKTSQLHLVGPSPTACSMVSHFLPLLTWHKCYLNHYSYQQSFLFFLADTFELFYNDPNGTKAQIPLSNTGIAWWTDKHVKFRNPGLNNPNLTAAFQGISRSSFFVYLPLGSSTLQPNMEANVVSSLINMLEPIHWFSSTKESLRNMIGYASGFCSITSEILA